MKRKFLLLKVLSLAGFVLASHVAISDKPVQSSKPKLDAGWQAFMQKHGVESFGEDGYFVRAVRHGHGLVTQTYDFAWRFTRKSATDSQNACSSCHSFEQLAYAFVNSDRYDKKLNKRVSFETRVMRCYAKHLDGFVPTVYDPAIRDIRIFARMVAHDLTLTEGSLPGIAGVKTP